jgi:hypothetical protein
MKKRILGLAMAASVTMLTSCGDPEQNSNDSVFQNSLIKEEATSIPAGNQVVGINSSSVPGLVPSGDVGETEVTVTFSGGAAAAQTAGCTLLDSDWSTFTGLSSTGPSLSGASYGATYDHNLAGLYCSGVAAGTYTADVKISFTAGGKSYTANTTLTSTVS